MVQVPREITTEREKFQQLLAGALGTLHIERTISRTMASTRRGGEELVTTFRQEYRWSLYALTSLALVIGIGLGLSLDCWFEAPLRPVDRAPVVQTVPAAKPRVKH
jgi:hypothetical protein